MTALAKRKTKLKFETACQIRGRALMVECDPRAAKFWLKGTREAYWISWEWIFTRAAGLQADRLREERKAKLK